jgi:hypothetical protein
MNDSNNPLQKSDAAAIVKCEKVWESMNDVVVSSLEGVEYRIAFFIPAQNLKKDEESRIFFCARS